MTDFLIYHDKGGENPLQIEAGDFREAIALAGARGYPLESLVAMSGREENGRMQDCTGLLEEARQEDEANRGDDPDAEYEIGTTTPADMWPDDFDPEEFE